MADDEAGNEAVVAQDEGAVEETPEAPAGPTVEELQAELAKAQEKAAAMEQKVKERDRAITRLSAQTSQFQTVASAVAQLQKGQAALAKAIFAQAGEEQHIPTPQEIYEAELKAGDTGPAPQVDSSAKDAERVNDLFEAYGIDANSPPEELQEAVDEAAAQWSAGHTGEAVITLKKSLKQYKDAQIAKASEAAKAEVEERQKKARQLTTAGGGTQGAAGGHLSDEDFINDWGLGKLPATPTNLKRAAEIMAKL